MRILMIFIILAVIIALIYWYMKPKVKINSIDWVNKTVNYKVSAGGNTIQGIQSINDTVINKSPLGSYNIYIESNPGGSFNYIGGSNSLNAIIKIGITKNGKVIVGRTIDFTDKTNIPSLTI